MSREYPTEFYDEVIPVPEDVDQAELNANGLYVAEGLTQDLARQLVEASKQPHVGVFCANDPGSRFGNLDKVKKWQAKGRLALPLLRESDDSLAGMGWMGPQVPGDDELQLPGAKVTFATRLYEGALKQGNTPHYVKAIVAAHGALYGNDGVWLETWLNNKNAVNAYKEAGFVESGLLLTESESRLRQYMMLGSATTLEAEVVVDEINNKSG